MALYDPRADRLVKIPYALFKRADSLQDAVGADPNLGPLLGRMSVVDVVRLALFEGLQVLERRYGLRGDQ